MLSPWRALWQCICDSSVPTMFTLFLGWGFGLSCTWNVALINNHKAFSWHGISFFRNSWKVNAKRIRTFFQLDLISTKSHLRVAITHARFLNYCPHHKRLKIVQNTRSWRGEDTLQIKKLTQYLVTEFKVCIRLMIFSNFFVFSDLVGWLGNFMK